MTEKELEEKFLKYSEKIKKATSLDNDTLLSLYGLYKQATVGECNIEEPYKIYYKEHAKYKAWTNNKDMSKENSMKAYIKLVKKILNDS